MPRLSASAAGRPRVTHSERALLTGLPAPAICLAAHVRACFRTMLSGNRTTEPSEEMA